jgi:hypothetical protein
MARTPARERAIRSASAFSLSLVTRLSKHTTPSSVSTSMLCAATVELPINLGLTEAVIDPSLIREDALVEAWQPPSIGTDAARIPARIELEL